MASARYAFAHGQLKLSAERNRQVCEQSFAALYKALAQASAQRLFVMIGAQGSGKSTWAENQFKQQAGWVKRSVPTRIKSIKK